MQVRTLPTFPYTQEEETGVQAGFGLKIPRPASGHTNGKCVRLWWGNVQTFSENCGCDLITSANCKGSQTHGQTQWRLDLTHQVHSPAAVLALSVRYLVQISHQDHPLPYPYSTQPHSKSCTILETVVYLPEFVLDL